MKIYNINCEIIVSISADTIDEAEERLKNRFNTGDTKFYQLIDYKEVDSNSSQH